MRLAEPVTAIRVFHVGGSHNGHLVINVHNYIVVCVRNRSIFRIVGFGRHVAFHQRPHYPIFYLWVLSFTIPILKIHQKIHRKIPISYVFFFVVGGTFDVSFRVSFLVAFEISPLLCEL